MCVLAAVNVMQRERGCNDIIAVTLLRDNTVNRVSVLPNVARCIQGRMYVAGVT